MVYFAEASNGLIKIGCSVDPPLRLKALQSSSPLPIKLLAVITDGHRGRERELHQRFAEQRSHFEWFSPSPELRKVIEEEAEPPPASLGLSSLQDRVYRAIIRHGGPLYTKAIAEQLEAWPHQVAAACRSLERRGLIRQGRCVLGHPSAVWSPADP